MGAEGVLVLVDSTRFSVVTFLVVSATAPSFVFFGVFVGDAGGFVVDIGRDVSGSLPVVSVAGAVAAISVGVGVAVAAAVAAVPLSASVAGILCCLLLALMFFVMFVLCVVCTRGERNVVGFLLDV